MSSREPTTGVVIGRFNPPHNGHRYLLDFAQAYVDHLYVLVCTLPSETIPGELRYRWVRELFPFATVVHICEPNPNANKGRPGSYRIWADAVRRAVGGGVDYVFASEDYGWKFADALGARYMPVDPARKLFPVSATMIRRNPMGSWDYIPPAVRPFFVRRVYLLSEDPSQSEPMLEQLADHFRTVFVGDYLGFRIGLDDVDDLEAEALLRAQTAAEEGLARQAERVLLCATDSTHAWVRLALRRGSAGAGNQTNPGHSPPENGDSATAPAPDAIPETLPGPSLSAWNRTLYFISPPARSEQAALGSKDELPVLSRVIEHLGTQRADVRVLSGSYSDRFSQAREGIEELLFS